MAAFHAHGVMTVAKQADNETRRNTYDALFLRRQELYYAPYQAPEAGCMSIMCAYNKINGHHACASDELLVSDLRERMAFKVLSLPTGAAHQYHAGLDVAMPGRVSTILGILEAGTLLRVGVVG